MTDREMIEDYAEYTMLSIESWDEENENGLTALLSHRWVVVHGDEDRGLYEGDEGVLTLCVVGAERYGNRRVSLSFVADGMDCGVEIVDLDVLDSIED